MFSINRRWLAGLAVLGATAAIAGCGGGDDDAATTTATATALSAEEFREQADAVCATSNTGTDALGKPTSADQFLPVLKSGLSIQATEITGLKALTPPADLKGAFDEALALLEERQNVIQGAADRIEAGENPLAVIQEVDDQIEELQDQAQAKADELGLTVCGRSDDDDTTTTTGTATAPAAGGEISRYAADAKEAAAALTAFGTTLQGVTSPDDLKEKIPGARASLDEFDAAIAKLDGYTLDNATLEEQRAGLARTGPDVTDVLGRFLDAAASGDVQQITTLLPEVQQKIQAFQQAATVTP